MIKMGKDKNLPLYILGGILVGLFGIPLGISGVAIIISMIGTVFSLIIAYFATAVSLVVAGFAGIVISIIRIADPAFIEQYMEMIDANYVSFFSNPTAEGIVGLIVSVLAAALGVLLLFLGRYIIRGTKFVCNLTIEKVKNFRKKK